MNRLTRLAVLPAATLLFGSLFTLAAPAANAAPCYASEKGAFVVATTSTVDEGWDSWTTSTVTATVITLTASNTNLHIHSVYDQNCIMVCAQTDTCVTDRGGEFWIEIDNGSGEYTLTATPVLGVPDIGTPVPADCNLVNTLGVCVGLEAGDEIERVTLREPVVGTTGGPGALGRLEQWRLPLPTGGSLLIPCVVLTVDGTGSTGCSQLGATYVSTVAVLVDDDVPVPTAGFGDVLATVGLCEATLTATVVGFGAEDLPAASLC